MDERFYICSNTITDSTRLYCNDISLHIVIGPAWRRAVASTANGTCKNYHVIEGYRHISALFLK
jgi:hypothetical protein